MSPFAALYAAHEVAPFTLLTPLSCPAAHEGPEKESDAEQAQKGSEDSRKGAVRPIGQQSGEAPAQAKDVRPVGQHPARDAKGEGGGPQRRFRGTALATFQGDQRSARTLLRFE